MGLKKKLLPTLFREEAEEAAVEVSGDESETADKKMTGKKKRKLEASEDEMGTDSKKPKSEEVTSDISPSNGNSSNSDQVLPATQNNAEESTSKKKKKKSKKNFKHQKNQISKKKKPDDGVRLSNERLKAYGVNPNKFKRDKRKERFKNAVKEKE